MTRNAMKSMLARRDRKIESLMRRLAVEKQLNNALRGMSFAPDQAPYHIREVNRALTMRKKLEVVS